MTTNKFIVCDERDVPMVFIEDQFYYVRSVGINSKRKQFQFGVEIYNRSEVDRLVQKHNEYRKKSKMAIKELKIIPVVTNYVEDYNKGIEDAKKSIEWDEDGISVGDISTSLFDNLKK